jgi:hypothetical protein
MFSFETCQTSEYPNKGIIVTYCVSETLIKVISKWLGANTILNSKVEFKNQA